MLTFMQVGVTTPIIDDQVALKVLKKNVFPRFEMPKILISNGENYVYNKRVEISLIKFIIHHRVAPAYHP